MIADGLTNRMIAARLQVSISTVEKHVGAGMQRWELPSRAAIAGAAEAERQRRSLL